MAFDQYIRGMSVVAMVGAGCLFLMHLVARPCDADWLAFLFIIFWVPAMVCALIFPFVWRLAQGRPFERKSAVFTMWAVAATAFEVAVALLQPYRNCFK